MGPPRCSEPVAASAGPLLDRNNTDILTVAQRLGARLKPIAAAEWAGPCPVCSGRDRFSLNTAKQVFNCRHCGVGGDAVDLVRHVQGGSFSEALDFLGAPEDHRGNGHKRIPLRQKPGDRAADAKREAFVREQIEITIRELVLVRGTPGELYLREARGINTDAIADVLARIDAIGWHPAVYFKQPGHELHGRHLGCIVGMMSDPLAAQPTGAISRTYLAPGAPMGIVRLSRVDLPHVEVPHARRHRGDQRRRRQGATISKKEMKNARE